VRRLVGLSLLTLLLAAPAGAFDFGERIGVTAAQGPKVFHHLVSAGRKHVAVAGGTVAVAWEDNRSGRPEVYVAFRQGDAPAFAAEQRVSTGGEAFEPALAALDGGRFLLAWEEGERIHLRTASPDGLGPVLTLDGPRGRQAAVAHAGAHGHLAWVAMEPAGPLLWHAPLAVDPASGALSVAEARAVDPVAEHPYQAYPALAALDDGGAVLVWEDRRFGHTRLFYSRRGPRGGVAEPQVLNAYNAPKPAPGRGDEPLRLGSGVMRPVLAVADRLAAAWLDKRDPGGGYAVWGAVSRDGGASFGANEKIQDDSAGSHAVPHWNVALAGHPGGLVVAAWDDAREAWSDPAETGDVFVSWNTGTGWRGDRVVPVAAGPGRQSQPCVALDEQGGIHLVWVEQESAAGPTRLWYAHGVLPAAP
jgi:hypothetical protein